MRGRFAVSSAVRGDFSPTQCGRTEEIISESLNVLYGEVHDKRWLSCPPAIASMQPMRRSYPDSARMPRNRSAASRRDILRRDRSNRTSAHAKAAKLSLISTADSIRPIAACLTST
jgi:hypothetical protein